MNDLPACSYVLTDGEMCRVITESLQDPHCPEHKDRKCAGCGGMAMQECQYSAPHSPYKCAQPVCWTCQHRLDGSHTTAHIASADDPANTARGMLIDVVEKALREAVDSGAVQFRYREAIKDVAEGVVDRQLAAVLLGTLSGIASAYSAN